MHGYLLVPCPLFLVPSTSDLAETRMPTLRSAPRLASLRLGSGPYLFLSMSDLAETRTLDPLIKSQLLYQLSYEVEIRMYFQFFNLI